MSKDFKKKCSYIWDYYKIHIAVVIFIIIVAFNLISNFLTKKTPALYVAPMNISINESSTNFFTKEFKETTDLKSNESIELQNSIKITDGLSKDAKKTNASNIAKQNKNSTEDTESLYQINYNGQMKTMTMSHSKTMDIVIMDKDAFCSMANNGFLCDIDEVLSSNLPKEYSSLKKHIVSSKEVDTFDGKFCNMKCGLAVDGLNKHFKESKNNSTLYIGIICTSKHKKNAAKYIDYIINSSTK